MAIVLFPQCELSFYVIIFNTKQPAAIGNSGLFSFYLFKSVLNNLQYISLFRLYDAILVWAERFMIYTISILMGQTVRILSLDGVLW
jgi:hypothetical protein